MEWGRRPSSPGAGSWATNRSLQTGGTMVCARTVRAGGNPETGVWLEEGGAVGPRIRSPVTDVATLERNNSLMRRGLNNHSRPTYGLASGGMNHRLLSSPPGSRSPRTHPVAARSTTVNGTTQRKRPIYRPCRGPESAGSRTSAVARIAETSCDPNRVRRIGCPLLARMRSLLPRSLSTRLI